MFEISMRELIVNLSDFLKTDTIEVKDHKYEGDIEVKADIVVSFRALKSSEESIYVNGTIKGFMDLECSLCLNSYKHQIEIPINSNIETENGQIDGRCGSFSWRRKGFICDFSRFIVGKYRCVYSYLNQKEI